MKKRVLILGPISDFGGREIMTNLLMLSLKDVYDTKVFSTISMSKKSAALKGVENNEWDTVNYYLFKRNFILKLTALITKILYNRKDPTYYFIKNRLSKPYFDFDKLYYNTIIKFVNKADLIIYSGEINGKWLREIIEISENKEIPLLVRVTGEIKSIPSFLPNIKMNFNLLAHSKQNVDILRNYPKINVQHIDQTTGLEKELLNLEIKENKPLVFGFLGRFSEEKGILELINTFSGNDKKLLIAGNGSLLQDVIVACTKYKNISYLGQLSADELSGFFKKIDILLIPSFEEGGPIVGIEAMAAGKLIVSTKVGAMLERLDHTGNHFWFSHNETDSLKLVLEDVAKFSKEQRLIIRRQVREKYITHNTFDVIKGKYLQLVEDLLNDSK